MIDRTSQLSRPTSPCAKHRIRAERNRLSVIVVFQFGKRSARKSCSVAQSDQNRKGLCSIGSHLSRIEFSHRYDSEGRVVGNRMSWLRLSLLSNALLRPGCKKRPGSCGTQDKRRRATAPGKPRLTSAAKGIASPAIVRLARRAEYQETGSFSSTEAHQTNPARFVRETSNPDVLSDAIIRPARERGRCGHA